MAASVLPTSALAAVDPVSAETQFVGLINQERTARGLQPLAVHADLVTAARDQASAIDAAGYLFHNPDLGSVTDGWTKLGENVGYGGSVTGLHAAFMNSPDHRANILDPAYTHVGVGVVVDGSTLWVAEVFMASSEPVTQTTFTPPFRDDDGLAYEPDIDAIAAAGITNGCRPEYYCPFSYVSRAEMASFLQRALGLATPNVDFFWDDTFSSHQSAINAIAEADISAGCGGGRYCPDMTLSRAEMAEFLARALELPPSTHDWFWDDNGTIHESAINSLADAGITRGCGYGQFCPFGGLTRGEMARFLVNALNL